METDNQRIQQGLYGGVKCKIHMYDWEIIFVDLNMPPPANTEPQKITAMHFPNLLAVAKWFDEQPSNMHREILAITRTT